MKPYIETGQGYAPDLNPTSVRNRLRNRWTVIGCVAGGLDQVQVNSC